MRYLTECRYIAVTATVCLKEIGGRKEAKNDSFDSADQIHQKTKHIFRSHTLRIIPWGNSTAYKKNRETAITLAHTHATPPHPTPTVTL